MRSRCFAFWAYTFACRKVYQLAYRSQRETPRDRALSGAFALIRVAKSRTGAAWTVEFLSRWL